MYKLIVFSLIFIFSCIFVYGHAEHNNQPESIWKESPVSAGEGNEKSWVQQIGSLHYVFLHFPIALIFMTAISEYLFARNSQPIFDHASRFMLSSAAILATPTAILGYINSYAETYTGISADYLFWHMWLGIATAVLALIAALIREKFGISKFYYFIFFILFMVVNITGYIGGALTFG